MGFAPLIDDVQYTTRMPADVDESQFGPGSTSLPPPQSIPPGSSGPTALSEVTNFAYFKQKCK